MTPDDARALLAACPRHRPRDRPRRDRPRRAAHGYAELDSMDHLNLVNALYDTGIDIPERDHPLITTIDGFVAYVVAAEPKEARHVT